MRSKRRSTFALVGVAAVGAVMLTALPLWADDSVSVDATADTTVTQVSQDGDNGAKSTLATCPRLCDNNPNGERDAVIEFNVAALPVNATNVKASLEVWSWQPFTATVAAHRADSGARGTGYGTWPLMSAALDTNSTVAKGYNKWDVSSVISGNGTYTFALRQTTYNTRIYWASRENTRSDIRPHLVLTYEAAIDGAVPPPVHTATVGPQPSTSTTSSAPSPSPSTSTSPSASASPTPSAGSTTQTNAPSSSVPGWKLAWADEFNGTTLDPAKWNAKNNTMVDYDLACITNRSQNVFVANGMATLRAQKESLSCGSQTRGYTTAYLDTIGKASFTYGRFEVRAKTPTGPGNSKGLWPAFWMRPNDGGKGEIDVVELPGGDQYYKAATQAIFYDYTPIKQDNRYTFPSGYPADGFHTYTTEWEPGVLRWYIDGKEVYRRDRTTTPWFDQAFSRAFHLRLNFQVGGWLGNPDSSTRFPADFQVDYVRVWRR